MWYSCAKQVSKKEKKKRREKKTQAIVERIQPSFPLFTGLRSRRRKCLPRSQGFPVRFFPPECGWIFAGHTTR
jgi:hypothetical protein